MKSDLSNRKQRGATSQHKHTNKHTNIHTKHTNKHINTTQEKNSAVNTDAVIDHRLYTDML